jgi:3-phosphoinositide dependent protein kinase-1
MDKSHIVREHKASYVATERRLLAGRLSDCDAVVALRFTFQDTYSLYMGLELCPGGDLYWQLKRSVGGIMNEAKTVFYVSEIVRAVQSCHEREVIHRDLKPENVLLDSTGHVKLCDFGSALDLQYVSTSLLTILAEQKTKKEKKERKGKRRCASFVGTAEYVAPEILEGEATEATVAVDLWSIGVLTFQLLTGRVPFKGASEYLTMQAVLSGKYEYPSSATVSPVAKDFIDKLLVRDPNNRLGVKDPAEIRAHPIFADIADWTKLRERIAPSVLTATGVGSDATVSESETDESDEEWRARVDAATAAIDQL